MVPNQVVRPCKSLVTQQLRVRVLKPGKICEGEIGQAPIKRIAGNTRNSHASGHVLSKGIQVLGAGAAAVEIKTRDVGHPPNAAGVGNRHIETPRTGLASGARKGVGQIRVGIMKVQTERQSIARAEPSATSTRRGSAETAVHTNIQIIAIVGRRSHKVKVLIWAGKVRQRNVLQQSLRHGIDAVMHSATKYLGGHSDLTAGAIVSSQEFIERVRQVSVAIGTTLDPSAAYLLARGIRTLDLRVRAACDNALKLAQVLARHPKVARVYYPGLEEDPSHKIAKRQMEAFGGTLAVDLVDGERAAETLFNGVRMVRTAPSLGGVETLISYPIYSSHAGFTPDQLRAAGVSENTVRVALGIEAPDDIIADITQALDKI